MKLSGGDSAYTLKSPERSQLERKRGNENETENRADKMLCKEDWGKKKPALNKGILLPPIMNGFAGSGIDKASLWSAREKKAAKDSLAMHFNLFKRVFKLKTTGLNAEDVQCICPRVADILILSRRAKMIRIVPKHRRGASQHTLPKSYF